MQILVEIKNVYGAEKIYPLCANGETFAKLAGTKTLTRDALQLIKSLGYSIEVKQPEVTL